MFVFVIINTFCVFFYKLHLLNKSKATKIEYKCTKKSSFSLDSWICCCDIILLVIRHDFYLTIFLFNIFVNRFVFKEDHHSVQNKVSLDRRIKKGMVTFFLSLTISKSIQTFRYTTTYNDFIQQNINKRYFIIDQQIARHFVQYSEFLSNPLPFYAEQIIDPFLNHGSQTFWIEGRDFSQL